jgi:outer membrane assembly lipoprotein YfiO
MPRRTLIAAIVLSSLTFAATSPAFAAPPAAEFRNGRWQPITEAPTSQPASDPQLDKIEELLKAGRNSAALDLGIYWVKNHPKDAPLRDRAIFLLGQANYQTDNHVRGFYYFDELMDEYPESKLFFPALERQYEIADGYLKGHKDRFLGLPILDRTEEAIEMLYRVQQRSPGSPLAEKALLRTADYYYSNADYDLAHDAYGAYVKNYPRSPMVPNVRLRQAFSSLAQFRGTRFDPSNMLDARSELADIVVAYPELAKEENIPSVIQAIDDTLAAKLFQRADFYTRTRDPRSAVYTYRFLLLTFPNSPQAPKAREALNRMPQWALNEPAPQPGSDFAPPADIGKVAQ